MLRAIRRTRAGLAAALALAALGCGRDEAPKSAILITLDTTRRDAPSLYGAHAGTTPALDRLAREALVYEDAHTTAPLTLPAHASMLTGLYPPRHSVRVNGTRALPSAARTVAEAAQAAGAETAAFLAAVVLAPEFGLDQGFGVYDAPARGNGVTSFYDERPAEAVVDAALGWLAARDRARPFFLWIHLFDPHEPYRQAPFPAQGPERVQRYLGEVAHADRELARLFDALRAEGALDQALVLVCADHGEGLDEHGEASHGDYCHETTLQVPFLVRYPDGTRAGERSQERVSVVDVAPTLAEAMGLPFPGEVDGQSLYKRRVPDGRGVYFESYGPFVGYGWSPIRGWLDGTGKLVLSSRARFYDLASDPREEHDVAARADLGPARAALGALAARPTLEEAEPSAVDDALSARIAGLGYASAAALDEDLPGLLETPGLRDPLASVALHGAQMHAYALLSAGRYPEASAAFEEVVAQDPDNPFALDHLATSLIREGRFEDAVPALERRVALGRPKASVLFNLGVSLHRLERFDEALAAFLRARELAPDDPRIARYVEELGG